MSAEKSKFGYYFKFMYTEARKLHLIDEVLKISNEATLSELELVVEKSKERKERKSSFSEFAGIWTEKEAVEIERIIEESCETINPDDWK